MAAIEPMNQFMIRPVVPLPRVVVPGVGSIDLSITNSVLYMLIAASIITVFFLAASRRAIVPGRMQALAETLYDLIDNGLTGAMIGDKGRPFLPFIFTLFSLIAVMNIVGLFPLQFTVTSQLAVTVTLALLTFVTVVILGFIRNGLGFFKLFVPSGVPIYILPLVVFIEVISFFLKPVSHSVRLFANMLAGHIALKVFASFVGMLGALGIIGWAGAVLPLGLTIALTALELLVAFLQAYVFAILTCIYLNEALHLHEHH